MQICFRTSLLILLLTASLAVHGNSQLPAPDRTVPTHGIVPAFTASARGVQIYRCSQSGATPEWVLVGPEAMLFQGLQQVGSHGAGPVWKWHDGSAVLGTVLEKQPGREQGAVPWLLLSAKPVPGSNPAGQLSSIAYVRRSETHGGVAPVGGCDAQHLFSETRSPYTANYTFYKTGPAQQ